MEISLERRPLEAVQTDAVIMLAFEGRKEERLNLAELFDSGETTGKLFEMTVVHRAPGIAAKRLVLAGAGKLERFDTGELRRVVAAAVRHLKTKSVPQVSLFLDGYSNPEYVAAAVEGAITGDYEPDRLKSDKS